MLKRTSLAAIFSGLALSSAVHADLLTSVDKILINNTPFPVTIEIKQTIDTSSDPHFQGTVIIDQKFIGLPPNSTTEVEHVLIGDWQTKNLIHFGTIERDSNANSLDLEPFVIPQYMFSSTAHMVVDAVFMGDPFFVDTTVDLELLTAAELLDIIPDTAFFASVRDRIDTELPGFFPTLSVHIPTPASGLLLAAGLLGGMRLRRTIRA